MRDILTRITKWWEAGESFGLAQVRAPYHPSAFEHGNARRSSAYNVDYTYAVWRACFEGQSEWLNTVEKVGTYAAGDALGCMGAWYAMEWHTPVADEYIASVTSSLDARVWATEEFAKG